MKNINLKILIFIIALFFSNSVFAYRLENFDNIPATGDYIVGPVKTELSLNPDQQRIIELSVLNRSGKTLDFLVSLEDFSAQENVELVKDGPYSLRDYIFPETSGFSLEHGQKIYIPIQIKIPQYSKPQSMHSAVVISASDPSQGDLKAVSRIASLFLITVKGYTKLDGQLLDFSFNQTSNPKFFKIVFGNNGNAYLNPNGKIFLFNWRKEKIKEIDINQFFVLPESKRIQKISLPEDIGSGKYTAKLELYRGYGETNVVKEIDFWIIDKKFLIIAIILIAISSFFVFSKFLKQKIGK